jgi:hypothetical protein
LRPTTKDLMQHRNCHRWVRIAGPWLGVSLVTTVCAWDQREGTFRPVEEKWGYSGANTADPYATPAEGYPDLPPAQTPNNTSYTGPTAAQDHYPYYPDVGQTDRRDPNADPYQGAAPGGPERDPYERPMPPVRWPDYGENETLPSRSQSQRSGGWGYGERNAWGTNRDSSSQRRPWGQVPRDAGGTQRRNRPYEERGAPAMQEPRSSQRASPAFPYREYDPYAQDYYPYPQSAPPEGPAYADPHYDPAVPVAPLPGLYMPWAGPVPPTTW